MDEELWKDGNHIAHYFTLSKAGLLSFALFARFSPPECYYRVLDQQIPADYRLPPNNLLTISLIDK